MKKNAFSFLTVFGRELSAYFNAAIAAIFIIVFVFLNGGLYMTQFFLVGLADMRSFFLTLPYLLAVFIPAVSMRQWAEERRGNTLELLLTFPVGTHQIVAGKFLAGLAFYSVALIATLSIPLMLIFLGRPDLGAVMGGYIGALFAGAFFLAIGIFISGLCRDQMTAFILSMLACFGIHLLGTDFIAVSIDGWVGGLGSFLKSFVGSAGHYETFAKGVVAGGDVLYFLIGTTIFLVLNGFWMEGRMRPGAKKLFISAALVCGGIFLMANWFFSGINLGRLDLTENQIYTVSPAARKILKELQTPVSVKFYVSPQDKMPTGMKTIEQDVGDKLDELRAVSHGKLDYKIFHLEAANAVGREASQDSLETEMRKKGIQPFEIQAVDSDEVAVKLVYASISISYKEKPEEMIPRVVPANLDELEYAILSKIYRMTLPESPRIALMAPYEEQAMDPQMRMLLMQLGGQLPETYRQDEYEIAEAALRYEGYETTRIRLTEKEPIPEGTKTLIILEPRELSERQLYEINRFLVSGGSVFLGVQPYFFDYRPAGRGVEVMPQDLKPGVNPLLRAWGLEISEEILADEQSDMISISGGVQAGLFDVSIPVKLPIQILIPQSGMNEKISITSNLSPLFYLWGSALQLDTAKLSELNLTLDVLLQTSTEAWTFPFSGGALNLEDFTQKTNSAKYPIAVRITGQFPDAYEGEPVPLWEKPSAEETAAGSPKAEENIPEVSAPAPGKLILIGAATPFQKQLIQGGGHLNFFLNSVDALTLGEDLAEIRSKQSIDRSIGRVPLAAKIFWRFFVTLLVPFIIALWGVLRMILRKKAKSDYLKSLSQPVPVRG